MIHARVIKSNNCARCQAYTNRLDALKFPYLVYNVDNVTSEQQKELDTWRITDMPIVQLVDDTGKVVEQMPFVEQGWSPRAIKHKIQELSK